jgi:hypothetical protein
MSNSTKPRVDDEDDVDDLDGQKPYFHYLDALIKASRCPGSIYPFQGPRVQFFPTIDVDGDVIACCECTNLVSGIETKDLLGKC